MATPPSGGLNKAPTAAASSGEVGGIEVRMWSTEEKGKENLRKMG